MNIHDTIQAAVRRSMARSGGGYPSAIVVSTRCFRQLLGCAPALRRMYVAAPAGGDEAEEFIFYVGMRLVVSPSADDFTLMDAPVREPAARPADSDWPPPLQRCVARGPRLY